MADDYTLMSIDDIEFPDPSIRGITMTLTPIDGAKQMARDCRGTLIDLSLAQFRKYRSTISCTDFEAPILTDVWPGKLVEVTFVPELGVENTTGGQITLSMRVVSFSTSRQEWQAETAWQLELEQE